MSKQKEETTDHFLDEILQELKKLNLCAPQYGTLAVEATFHAGLIKRLVCRTEVSILHS